MKRARNRIPRPLWLLAAALPLLSLPVTAQETGTGTAEESREIEALEPGVDTSSPEMAADGATPSGNDNGNGEAADAATEPPKAAEVERVESGGQVMDRMELGRTEITGSQELPKVLYIVPWQKAEHGELSGRPVNTLLDEVLAPVDREEFIRTVDYYREMNGGGTD